MTAEFWAIIGVGISLALLLYQFTGGLRGEIGGIRGEIVGIRGEIGDLRERMARVEGMLEVIRDFVIGKQPTA